MSLPRDDDAKRDENSEDTAGNKPRGLGAAGIVPTGESKKTVDADNTVNGEGSSSSEDRKIGAGEPAEEKRPKKKPVSEMTADERREHKEQTKKRRVLVGSIVGGLVVALVAVLILTVDFGSLIEDDDTGGDELVDDGGEMEGERGPLTDDGGESGGGSEQGFPMELDGYLEEGYNSANNEESLNAYESSWSDTEDWNPPELDENGTVTFDEWDQEANAPADPRRELSPGDDGYAEAQGWIYRDNAEQEYRDGYIGDIAQYWPSREQGFTNNSELFHLEDGSMNPWFSYVVAEDVQWFFGNNLQRLLNPVYGGWFYDHSEPKNIDLTLMQELFTDEWWNENIVEGDASNLPIYADWEDNDYGVDDVGSYGWFGDITDTNLEVAQNDEGDNIINGRIFIEYHAVDSDNDSLETREAQLDIQVIPNREDPADVNNRLLINEAELTMTSADD